MPLAKGAQGASVLCRGWRLRTLSAEDAARGLADRGIPKVVECRAPAVYGSVRLRNVGACRELPVEVKRLYMLELVGDEEDQQLEKR
jgi:hypothetical protein